MPGVNAGKWGKKASQTEKPLKSMRLFTKERLAVLSSEEYNTSLPASEPANALKKVCLRWHITSAMMRVDKDSICRRHVNLF